MELDKSKPIWRVVGYVTDPDRRRATLFVNADSVSEAVAVASTQGMEGVSHTSLANEEQLAPEVATILSVKKYRIINLATNAEYEADTSEEVWEIIGKEIPFFGLYEIRDNLTNQIVSEFIPL